ncbi:MAG: hypothetical protein A2Y15_03150 [Clostridiales bacterium GWF2_36_10]|nr:MAG: hypothetical protein A2Y15_03150 [Clostridiales bacterium GWF2_36_10]
MFNTKKFGGYISRLRKKADMTQSELAEKLNLSRQAISKYEVGDSFPDISILILISNVFNIMLDELINSGEPTKGEVDIINSIAQKTDEPETINVSDIINLAPLLKPSILNRMAQGLGKQGIDISNIVTLAEYLSNDSVLKLLENATFDTINDEFLEKLIPFLDDTSKSIILEKVINGELGWHLIKTMLPYIEYMTQQIEAAVVEGVFI